jgi:regulator of replication initiation timing
MCRISGSMRSVLLRALFCAALLSSGYLVAQVSGSTRPSSRPDGLWQALLEQTQSLPKEFSDFEISLTTQINSLRLTNQSLLLNNSNLEISNASLTESLRLSRLEAATSAAKSKRLQTDLDASTNSITQATIEAKALELKVSTWKILGIGGLAAGVGGVVFGLIRALK